MPKVNTPEISKGFWITVGVLAALLAASAVTMVYQRAKSRA